MAAGHLPQLWGTMSVSRVVLVNRLAPLRPLGLLLPPQPRPLVLGIRRTGGNGGLETNPFYEKYQRKIQELRRSNPDIFESFKEQMSDVKMQPVEHQKQAEFARLIEEKHLPSCDSNRGCQPLPVASALLNVRHKYEDSVFPTQELTDAAALGLKPSKVGFTKNKTLDSILNVEMMKKKKPEEIKQIWKQYFSGEDTVYAVIPGKTFDVMWKRAQNCPSFLYALPRKEGYEFFVGQWSRTEVHFTSLINIQTRGEAVTSQLILYHYPELQEEKGIVLMTAEMDSHFLNVPEAQCLASQVQLFYATDRKETYGLVEKFNHHPDEFKYMSVIAELEQSRLGQELRPQQDLPPSTA